MPSLFTDLTQELFWFFKNSFKMNINSIFVCDLSTIHLSTCLSSLSIDLSINKSAYFLP